jgi:short-subunit dehydrogenase
MKHVLITGASTGIGFAIAEALASDYVVWAGVRNPASLDGLVQRFGRERLRVLKLDVTSAEDIRAAIQSISSEANITRFDLINNAGVATGGPLECLSMKEFENVFNVNVLALVAVTQAALPLIRRTKGRIVNIGSISGLISTPYMAAYSGSKFAVRAITDALRREMRPFGVKVALIEPGPIDTKIWGKSLNRADELRAMMSSDQAQVYSREMDSLFKGVQKTAKHAVPPSWVVAKVRHALDSSCPRLYYKVGRYVPFMMVFVKMLPTRLLDRMLGGTFRFAIGE